MSEANGAYHPPPGSAPVPDWVAEEIKTTWRAARDAGGEMAAFRIIERMVDRLGYGRTENNPSLVPNPANLARESASVDQHSVVGRPNSERK